MQGKSSITDFELRPSQIIINPTQPTEQRNEPELSSQADKKLAETVINLKLFVTHESLEAIVGKQLREIKRGNRNPHEIEKTVAQVFEIITSTLTWIEKEYPQELSMTTFLSYQGWANIANTLSNATSRPLSKKEFEIISSNKKIFADEVLDNEIPDFKLNSNL